MEDTEPINFKISQIDWQNRQCLNMGKEGIVYRVAPGVVVKVDGVSRHGVELQKRMVELGLSVPVFDFNSGASLPIDLAHEVCKVHGARKDLLADDLLRDMEEAELAVTCNCNRRIASLLLMAEAQPLSPEEQESDEVIQFRERLRDVYETLGINWDFHNPDNVMRYKGALVVIDFG